MPQTACAQRKLVINSHFKYRQALDHLVASLKEHRFPLNDVVVFRGGANISAVLEHPGPRLGQDGMTFVDIAVNSFDLTAFAGLAMYNNHSLVCADMYFYIHDTTQIGPCFPKVFEEIKVALTEVITPGRDMFSNQCVFGRSVVDKFGNAFQPTAFESITKQAGFEIERGGCSGRACSINHYAVTQTVIPRREKLGTIDVYGTSKPRTARWYREWDFYKFFLLQDSQTAMDEDFIDRKIGRTPRLLKQPYLPIGYRWAASCPRVCKVEGNKTCTIDSADGHLPM